MYATPFSTSLTVFVIAVSLVLPLGFYVAVKNVERLSNSIETNYQISLFLKPQITLRRAEAVAAELKKDPHVLAVKLVSKKQALKEFQLYSGFGEALDMLDENPLPHVIEIQPKQVTASSSDKLTALVQNFQRHPTVDIAQLDMKWVSRLNAILVVAQRGVLLLSLLLGLAVVLTIGNTIRLELQRRREEIVILKLVGGTNSFVRRPFLYSGFWYGFLGGVIAWLIVTIVVGILTSPMNTLAGLYESELGLLSLSFGDAILFIFFSSLLGWFGAWIVLVYQLRRLNPE